MSPQVFPGVWTPDWLEPLRGVIHLTLGDGGNSSSPVVRGWVFQPAERERGCIGRAPRWALWLATRDVVRRGAH